MALSRYARANHILVPGRAAERDRWRHTPTGRLFSLLGRGFRRLSSEGLTFFALAIVTMLFAFDVRYTQRYVAWGALFGLLGASWLCSFFYPLRGVTARVRVPRRFARGVPTPIVVELASTYDRPHFSLRTRGPFLPWDGEWTKRAAGLPKLAARGRATVEVEAAFHQRGEHHIDPFRVQALVPFGLALGAPVTTESPRFLVVPRIAVVDAVPIPRTRRHHPGGVPRALHTADSRELAGVRPYRAGDPVRELHARTWARTGTPFVREYQEEYFTHVAVVVDGAAAARPPRRRGDNHDDPLEGSLALAAGIVAKLLGGEALVELSVLSDGADPVALGRGRGTLEVALDCLATVRRRAELDVELEVQRIAERASRYSGVVMVLSAADSLRQALLERLAALGIEVLAIYVEATDGERAGNVRRVSATRILAGEAIAL